MDSLVERNVHITILLIMHKDMILGWTSDTCTCIKKRLVDIQQTLNVSLYVYK